MTNTFFSAMLLAVLVLLTTSTGHVSAFVGPTTPTPTTAAFVSSSSSPANRVRVVVPTVQATSALNVFNRKKQEEEDLSYIETRDMTREEMAELNQLNEDIMTSELWGMTIFSLIISVPMLYLVWVGFFSETAEMNL